MKIRQIMKGVTLTAALTLAALLTPGEAAAHCDSMDGPVVTAARAALASGRVELVLGWVRPQDEEAIREAFNRTTDVRQAGGEAQELADLWFFETLVRIHREGEGAPYTGLKPAGQEPAAGIAEADAALSAGSVDALASHVAEAVAGAIRERFEAVRALADHDPTDVDATRAYVHAYVSYVHFVEAVAGLLHGGGHGAEGH